MGFLGLFNYSKPGPGIAKDAPKKKTFFVFFETFFRNFWKFIPINFIYSLISIPVITSGIANAGLTNVARNTALDKHSFGLSDFFDTIKANFGQAFAVGIINTVVYALLFFDIYFFYMISGKGYLPAICLGLSIGLLFVFYVMNFYIFTLMITFNFTTGQLYKNSFRFVFLNMKKNILCSICILLTTGFFVGIFLLVSHLKDIILGALVTIIVSSILLPLAKFLIIQYNVFPTIRKYVIDPYYAEHPEDDIEKRRNLGLDVPEDDEEETEESVFND